MLKLTSWCKRCFGIRTIRQRMIQELQYAELDVYTISKQIALDTQSLKFYNQRIAFLQKQLKGNT